MMNFEEKIKALKRRLTQQRPGEKYHHALIPEAYAPSKYKTTHNNASKSSVLILLFPFKNDIGTVFIKRAKDGTVHSGQISFPGGRYEPQDTDLYQTALRESHEEIGVAPKTVSILGHITELYISASNFLVFPVIGVVESIPGFQKDPVEVDDIVTEKLSDLFADNSFKKAEVETQMGRVSAPGFKAGREFIWGATAMMLNEFKAICSESGILLHKQ